MSVYRIHPQAGFNFGELVIDNFAGGGGASTGIEAAMGRPVDVAINHDPAAVALHEVNHPHTRHSWYIAPTWWLWWNNIVEPKLMVNCNGNMDAIRKFRAVVKRSIESGEYVSTHSMYLDRVAGNGAK